MDRETIGIIFEKALSKKDGVYSFRGHKYLVLKNRMRAYSESKGSTIGIYEPFSGFVTEIGEVNESWDVVPALKKLIPQFKNKNY